VDVLEAEDHFVIVADLPGVDPAKITVTMEEGLLSIQGEREVGSDVAGRITRRERPSGHFQRRFSLPETADPQRISATGRDGVLEVTIHKLERVKPRRIKVSH